MFFKHKKEILLKEEYLKLSDICNNIPIQYTTDEDNVTIKLIHFSNLYPVEIVVTDNGKFKGFPVGQNWDSQEFILTNDNYISYFDHVLINGDGLGSTIPYNDESVLDMINMKWFLTKSKTGLLLDSIDNSSNYIRSFDSLKEGIDYLKSQY